MMRLLFLCLILRVAVATSEESEGSADGDEDDEDLLREDIKPFVGSEVDTEPGMKMEPGKMGTDKSTAEDGGQNEFITIVAVAVVGGVVLSIVAIGAVVLVRRRMHSRQQGIYSVPVEQAQKRAV